MIDLITTITNLRGLQDDLRRYLDLAKKSLTDASLNLPSSPEIKGLQEDYLRAKAQEAALADAIRVLIGCINGEE